MAFPDLSAFSPQSPGTWRDRLEREFKGQRRFQELIRYTEAGLPIRPFYTAEDTPAERPPVPEPGWTLRQELAAGQLAQAPQLLPEAWQDDVHCCVIALASAPEARQLAAVSRPAEASPAAGQAPEASSLRARLTGPIAPKELAELPGKLQATGWLPEAEAVLELDPFLLAFLAQTKPAEYLSMLGPTPELRPVSAGLWAEYGADAVLELALGIASLEALPKHAPAELHLTSGGEYFVSLALFRAARLLWQQHGHDPAQLRITGHTAGYTRTHTQPHNNLIRQSAEALAISIGGADELHVRPFMAQPKPEDRSFTYRLARNLSHLLRYESYLDRTADPAAGSYFLESLTASISQAASELLQTIDQQGGLAEAVSGSWLSEELQQGRAKRRDALAEDRQAIIGVTRYPTQLPADDELPTPPSPANPNDPRQPHRLEDWAPSKNT